MCHSSCYLTCVFIMAVCLKTVAIAGNKKYSLTLKYDNNSTLKNLTEHDISSINVSHLCNQDIDNKEPSTHFIINCSFKKNRTSQSFPCNLTRSSQRCLTGVHLNHTSCPRIPLLFTNATIPYLDSKILSFRNCNISDDAGERKWPIEGIIIASCSTVTLLIMITVSCIVIRRKGSKTQPTEIVAEITTLNDYIQTASKPVDIAAEGILANNDTMRTPSAKISEIINSVQSSDEGDMKNHEQDSSLADSGAKLLSEIHAREFSDTPPRASVETPVATLSKEVDIDYLGEFNVYSFIDNEGGDALQTTARAPKSLQTTRSTMDSSITEGTISNGVNETRDVYYILEQEIRDFQNPYNETATERDRRSRASNDTTKINDCIETGGTKHLNVCDTGSNDVYSRLGEEIKEFENTYNL